MRDQKAADKLHQEYKKLRQKEGKLGDKLNRLYKEWEVTLSEKAAEQYDKVSAELERVTKTADKMARVIVEYIYGD